MYQGPGMGNWCLLALGGGGPVVPPRSAGGTSQGGGHQPAFPTPQPARPNFRGGTCSPCPICLSRMGPGPGKSLNYHMYPNPKQP